MTIVLTAALLVTVVGFLVLLDRMVTRHAAALHMMEQTHRTERGDLLQRIQAPERAVVQHEIAQATEADMPQPPLTDEDYEDYADQQASIRALEAAENAHLMGRA